MRSVFRLETFVADRVTQARKLLQYRAVVREPASVCGSGLGSLLKSMDDVVLRRQLLEHLKSSGCKSLGNLTGRQEHAVELFAAWMAAMRDLRRGQGTCEIFSRFMDQYNSRVADFLEVQDVLKDVLEVGATDLAKTKLWRFFVWMWLGCGGAYMKPWRACRNWHAVRTYKDDDEKQPLVILKFVHVLVDHSNSLTAVIGADGLDKKARLFRERDLVDWHASVPKLVAALKKNLPRSSTRN